jgi:hypothetical protein
VSLEGDLVHCVSGAKGGGAGGGGGGAIDPKYTKYHHEILIC